MDEKKFGKILTVVLVVLIVLILGMLVYFGYAAYSKNKTQSNSDNALQEFEQKIEKKKKEEETTEESTVENPLDKLNETEKTTSSQTTEKTYLDGFEVIGRIKIPKTGVDYPILAEVTTNSLSKAVAFFYGVGLNKPGNSTIMGHNYRNGLFFSNNKKLVIGDKVLITDETGEEVTYTIYDIFTETPDYADYMKRDTEGKREISLSTCTDDSSARLIILASAD